MKLRNIKTPANDYVVTVRNGKRISGDKVQPEQNADRPKARETDAEALEKLGLVMKLPWPDPSPD